MKNNIDEIETVNPTDELELDVKTLQKRLGEKLGIIEEECQKVQCKLGIKLGIKLGESLYKVGRKSPFFTFLLYFSPKITGQTIAKILDISTTSVDNHIKWFKEREVLERIGNDRNGYWKINID